MHRVVRRIRWVLLAAGLGVVFQAAGCGLIPVLGDSTTAPVNTVAGFLSDFTREWVAAMLL